MIIKPKDWKLENLTNHPCNKSNEKVEMLMLKKLIRVYPYYIMKVSGMHLLVDNKHHFMYNVQNVHKLQ
jgi:hypothetical protein